MSLLAALSDGFRRMRVTRELRSLDRGARQDAYWAFRGEMMQALELLERDHAARARQVWQQAHARFPEQAIRSELAADLLLKLGMFDELERLLTLGLRRHPSEARFLEGLAQVAFEQNRPDDALRHCETLRRKHPGSDKGYKIAGAVLSTLGRAEEAEKIFGRALQILPDDAALLIEHAKLAERRGDWDTALLRWDRLHEVCQHHTGPAGAAIALAHLGRFAEADERIEGVRYRFGNEYVVWRAAARVAEIRSDWDEAARRWAYVRKRFPLHPIGFLDALPCLRHLGRDAEIETMLRQGIEQIRDEPRLLVEYAMLAHHKRDWQQAAERWAAMRTAFPDRAEGYIHGIQALESLGQAEQARALRQRVPA